MAKFFTRAGIALLVLVILLAIAALVWEPMAAMRGEAPPERDYDVEIIRDDFGVPHIFGKTDADTAYGVAWAHSEDDFATLQEVAAMTRMRAGALTGEEGAQIDFVGHLLDIRGTVDRHYDALPQDVRALLDAYAAGLNDYAEEHPDEVKLSGLFPVNGQDIAAGFALRSPFFFGLSRYIGALAANEDIPDDGGPSLAKTAMMTPLGDHPELNGSNAFAVAPERTPDNVTRLVSNSHQPWRGGVAWYELVVHSDEGWDFAGATFPGSPYPFLGHNRNLGWTNTVNRPDLIDLYKLDVDDAGKRYKLDGEWRDLESERVWLGVKMGPFTIPYPQTFYRSAHGPVIKNDKGYFAIRYAGIDELDMLTQYYRIQKARDFDEWREAMAIQGVPATNFVYADKDGNIAMFYNALFPDRKPGADWRKVLPGDRSDLIWKGAVDWSEVPKLINPASGYVFNSNNTPYMAAGPGDELDRADFSPLLGIEENWTNRAARAIALFEAAGPIDRETMARIKYDTAYEKSHYPLLWMKAMLAVDPKGDKQIADIQSLLKAWDWNMDGKGKGDAAAAMLMQVGLFHAPEGLRLAEDLDARTEMKKVAEHLQEHFGTLDPPLGDLVRVRQGDVDLPMIGGADALRATTRWDFDEDGRLSVVHGDSFIMFVEWDAEGNVTSRSVQPFGAATTRPDNRHYADQAALFVKNRTKPVYFTREQLAGHIERQYRPGRAAKR